MTRISQYHPQLVMQRGPITLDQGLQLRSLWEFPVVIGTLLHVLDTVQWLTFACNGLATSVLVLTR